MPVSGGTTRKFWNARLAPAQQDVALAVALELQHGVELEGVRATEAIHLHGVVDHQIGRQQRVGARGVGPHGRQGIAHGGEIHHGRDAGEVLQQHARGHEVDLLGVRPAHAAGHVFNVRGRDLAAVFPAQQVFQQDAGGERQAGDVADAFLFQRRKAKDVVIGVADAQFRGGAE